MIYSIVQFRPLARRCGRGHVVVEDILRHIDLVQVAVTPHVWPYAQFSPMEHGYVILDEVLPDVRIYRIGRRRHMHARLPHIAGCELVVLNDFQRIVAGCKRAAHNHYWDNLVLHVRILVLD